jgi:hypothetical protein
VPHLAQRRVVQQAALRAAVLLVVQAEALPLAAELQEPLVRVPRQAQRQLPEQWLEQLLARSLDWA